MACPQLNAADKEVREFAVTIDGKPAGTNTMTFETDMEGRQHMSSQAKISISHLIKRYQYSYYGSEIWKNGLLVGFSSVSNDDGKRFKVIITPTEKALKVRANDEERLVSPAIWMTTYWRMPDGKLIKDGEVKLVDADTGKYMTAKFRNIGVEKIEAAGRHFNLTHCRLTGGVNQDLWYDADGLLARQEFDEDGHHVILTLKQRQE